MFFHFNLENRMSWELPKKYAMKFECKYVMAAGLRCPIVGKTGIKYADYFRTSLLTHARQERKRQIFEKR